MKKEVKQIPQATIAQALATDYFCIYYVDVESDRFTEYYSSDEYKQFNLPETGDDFISFSHERFYELICPDDRERFLERFTKENVVDSLDRQQPFTMTFRMMFHGYPTHVNVKVTRMIEENGHHAVIGISNVDEQMKAREAFENAHNASLTYSRMAQSLAADYFSIYVVDLVTDKFVEYSSTTEYKTLGVERHGDDFFELSRRNMDRLLYPEDKDRFMRIFTKENVMGIIKRDGHFTTKHRLMFGDNPVYVSMKATLMEDVDGAHLIIGTNNIDAQMKREQEYQKTVAQAKTDAKNDFLANMSHDIRTPMNAIVGYTNIARKNLDDKEKVEDALNKIGSSSHFLLSLINDILDISKIENGKVQLNYQPCDLAELFSRIEDITALQAKNKSLNISYNHDTVEHFMVNADELRIEQILINIISNAIKYTPEGKNVEITVKEDKTERKNFNKYTFIVKDTGIGISEDYLPYIFDTFSREMNTTINKVQGTGLGLAITARIVELMDGTISVKSKLNEGSQFTVELELESLEQTEEEKREDETIDLSGKRILIVEDNRINAEIARMILQQYGVESDTAVNGEIGLNMIRENREYDAVLMDIQMPVMNGYETTRAIRALDDEYYKRIPIIAMSANAYDEDVKACLEAGMNAHLAKPFDPEDLVRIIYRNLA